MIKLDAENTIYDNIIEQYFHEFFESRGLDLYGSEYKSIPHNVFQAAFRYVYKKVFKPDETTSRKYRVTSKIDYDDAYTLNQIIDIFGDIVYSYDIKSTRNMFCDMTGIHRDTLHSWLTGNTRAYIYYNTNGEVIKDIQEYKLNNRGEYTKELSTSHSDLVKKIDSFSKGTAYNGLNDTPVGQITHANNSKEAGMEYNSKRQTEMVEAHRAISLEELRGKIGALGGGIVQQIETKEQ